MPITNKDVTSSYGGAYKNKRKERDCQLFVCGYNLKEKSFSSYPRCSQHQQ